MYAAAIKEFESKYVAKNGTLGRLSEIFYSAAVARKLLMTSSTICTIVHAVEVRAIAR
jgi:hypothetical protein